MKKEKNKIEHTKANNSRRLQSRYYPQPVANQSFLQDKETYIRELFWSYEGKALD